MMHDEKLFLSSIMIFVLLLFLMINSVGADWVLWSQTYGGEGVQAANSLVVTPDGGFALAGRSLLIKTDAYGNMEWNKTYGGTWYDTVSSLVETSDGGFALAGRSQDFFGSGAPSDFFLVKTYRNGIMQWSRTYGGTNGEIASSLVQTPDGGFALAGSTGWATRNRTSSGGYNVTTGKDLWMVKTDTSGHLKWSQTYGGAEPDGASSLVVTSDGGFVIAGSTESFGAGGSDIWLIKTDANGNMLWNRTYGGAGGEYANSLVQTPDGG